MKSLRIVGAFGAFVLLFVLAACAHADASEPSPTPGSSPIGDGSGNPSSSAVEQVQRDAAIYAAVIRQLVTKDHTFGGADPGFRVIYLVDGFIPGAGNPETPVQSRNPAEPFPHALQDGIRLYAKLAGLPPIKLVSDSSMAVIGTKSGEEPGRVRGHGVLVTLEGARGSGKRFEVGANLWLNGLAGYWATYVVQERNGRWGVTGTTGPVAIS